MIGELEAVRVFLAVAEKRGFAAAAAALGMTPSAATRAVAALEVQFGLIDGREFVQIKSGGRRLVAHISPIGNVGVAGGVGGATPTVTPPFCAE